MPLALLGREQIDLPGEARPRTDQRHLSFQNIDELGQLIAARATQPSANWCDARIMREHKQATLRAGWRAIALQFAFVHLPMQRVVRIGIHRTEFEELKRPTVLADPDL